MRVRISKPGSGEARRSLANIEMGKIQYSGVLWFGFLGLHADCRSGGRVALAIHRCRKPTIAAINGSAVGVGITMCLPMSIRIAYSEAKIGFVFARRGLILEACSSFFLPRLIG